jgi:hypothetical protein
MKLMIEGKGKRNACVVLAARFDLGGIVRKTAELKALL